MGAVYSNNASSSLANSISDSATAMSVNPGDGVRFPVLALDDWCMLTLTKLVGGEAQREIVKMTARAADVFTIVRAQEGTTPLSFSAGDKVELRVTAGGLNSKFDKAGGTIAGPVTVEGAASFGGNASFAGDVTMQDKKFAGAVLQDCGSKVATVPAPAGTVHTIDYRNGSYQVWSPPPGPCTLVITNWPPVGIHGELWIEGVNLGLCTITTQVPLDYLKPDGSYVSTPSMNTNQGATLRNSGIDNVLIWGREGAPKRAKVAR